MTNDAVCFVAGDTQVKTGRRVERRHVLATDDFAPYEARALQHIDVLADRIERDRKFRGNVGHASLFFSQARKNRASCRVRYCPEHRVRELVVSSVAKRGCAPVSATP